METASGPAAVPHSERFASVDLLRGVAVCGILLMNIVAFGMPAAAYLNPNAYHGEFLSNHLLFSLTHIFADQKFMGLFSLLFGSSVMLFIHKARTAGLPALRLHYSRTIFLLLFGFMHSLLLWPGDILLYYALCGLLLYPLWRAPALLQFALGVLVFLSAIPISRMGQNYLESLQPFSLSALEATWEPSLRDIQFETSLRLSGYWEQLTYRSTIFGRYDDPLMDTVSDLFVAQGLARALGLMLVGMAFYSWGITTGQRSAIFYRRLVRWGLALGLPIVSFGLWRHYLHDWDMRYGLFAGVAYNHLATPLMVVAYVGLILRIHLGQHWPALQSGLRALGRMAFSNYIAQSLICTTLFYGYGLGWFGQLDRFDLLLLVIAIWITQIYLSRLWLNYFSQGPLEWLWRRLTYLPLRLQPRR